MKQSTKAKTAELTVESARELANPSCKMCWGTGLLGTLVTPIRHSTTGQSAETRKAIPCRCVKRAVVEGDATPWLRRRRRTQGKAAP